MVNENISSQIYFIHADIVSGNIHHLQGGWVNKMYTRTFIFIFHMQHFYLPREHYILSKTSSEYSTLYLECPVFIFVILTFWLHLWFSHFSLFPIKFLLSLSFRSCFHLLSINLFPFSLSKPLLYSEIR